MPLNVLRSLTIVLLLYLVDRPRTFAATLRNDLGFRIGTVVGEDEPNTKETNILQLRPHWPTPEKNSYSTRNVVNTAVSIVYWFPFENREGANGRQYLVEGVKKKQEHWPDHARHDSSNHQQKLREVLSHSCSRFFDPPPVFSRAKA